MDEEDEGIQDWGFLNKQAQTQLLPKDEALPKRSTKFFEQDGLEVQNTKLDHARNQMYLALLSIRGHHVKQKLQAVWMTDRALIPHAKGGFFKDSGKPCVFRHKSKLQGMWLSGIEAVYLAERGSLLVYESNTDFETFVEDERQEFDFETLLQMSSSHLYSVAFTDPGALDRYQVYALLKRLGYLVMDFKRLDSLEELNVSESVSPWDAFASLGTAARRWCQYVRRSLPCHFFSYTEVYESLRIIPTYSAPILNSPPLPIEPEYQLVFNVWKPLPVFSKKNPPCPDFQVGVLNIAEVSFPSLDVMKRAWSHLNMPCTKRKKQTTNTGKTGKPEKSATKKAPPTKKELRSHKRQERESKLDPRLLNRNNYLKLRDRKLKSGSTGRSVVYAIIDNGIINFVSFNETEFKLDNFVSELDDIEPRRLHGIVWNEKLDLA